MLEDRGRRKRRHGGSENPGSERCVVGLDSLSRAGQLLGVKASLRSL